MMWPSPGSIPWLLRHELRMLWRRYDFGTHRVSGAALAVGVAAVAQLVGFGMAVLLRGSTTALADRLALANAVLLVVGGLMLSHAMDAAVAAVFERRDLDWLRASPMPLRRVLLVRMVSLAAVVAGPWLLLLGPVANAMAAGGRPGWLAGYPVLCVLALLATAAGAALAVGLVSALGLRRARRAINALGLLIGGLAFLAAQSAVLLVPGLRAALWRALAPACCGMPSGVAWWPARALLGDAVPLAAVLLLGLGLAASAAGALERRFTTGAALAPPSLAQAPRRPGTPLDARRFRRSTFQALMRKELRLLRRTPNLLSRAAYMMIYALPAAGAAWRSGGDAAVLGLGAVSVFVAGEAARLLICAAVNTDEAAELAGSAPVPPAAVQGAKMAAAGLGAMAIPLLPVLAVAALRPALLPVLAGGVACVIGSGLLMGIWRPVPVRRGDLGAGLPGTGPVGNGLLGSLVNGCWSAAAWLAMGGDARAALPAALALAVLALVRPRAGPGGRRRRGLAGLRRAVEQDGHG